MAKWILPIFDKVLDVMSACTFAQFIEEEAIQTCSLGMFIAMRSQTYIAVGWCIQTLESDLIPHLKAINEITGWLAPYSQGAFRDFVLAAEVSLEVYKELLQKAATRSLPKQ